MITFVWFIMLLRVDFRTRTKTSFRKMTTVMRRNSPNDVILEDSNQEAKKFFEMLSAANNPLYDGCENYSQMSIIGRMKNLKMTSRFYDTKKQIAGLGLPSERIDCCINGCMIY